MKPGDRVVCLDPAGCLLARKEYEVSWADEDQIRVKGSEALWNKKRFGLLLSFPPPTIIFRTVKQASADNGQTWVDVP